ncbi:hypothetical protein G6F46_003546 [Rhizopus delemar]|uniref:Protein kinase domain-containing protein n=2 Tax=Rhizopus TaxID=4842 RepID=A0A9P6ZAA7_9FUNG|nr:hypothetical protein G6F55_003063 [Rhizopus delemar]KAG1548338.1 hypothetical protein G6F51_003723 [Rhizopus arrhizus]KAG1501512.1 hypothetical protein G6F54_002992 [Rhizopus delemar]KAG1515096.1 hypothetical protein G6F53_003176 [Rhizopus delemar]KAG1528107.1 hypothetical protein G6F52_000942 [Rhizopus delemar]
MTFCFYSPFQFYYYQRKSSRVIGERYRLIQQIGRGSSGLVHLAYKNCTRYAIKEIPRSHKKQQNLEIGILKELKPHKNIIQFFEIIEESNSIFLVMEMVQQGPVMDIVPYSFTKPYSNTQCKHLFKQLIDAIDHLHQQGILHGDIKPENILLTNNQTIKLIDFGNASHISDKASHIGSPAFMAPELLKKVPHLPTSTDIWAAGVTLYCLAYGHLPFQQPNFIQLYQDILTKPSEGFDQPIARKRPKQTDYNQTN